MCVLQGTLKVSNVAQLAQTLARTPKVCRRSRCTTHYLHRRVWS